MLKSVPESMDNDDEESEEASTRIQCGAGSFGSVLVASACGGVVVASACDGVVRGRRLAMEWWGRRLWVGGAAAQIKKRGARLWLGVVEASSLCGGDGFGSVGQRRE